MYPHHLCLCSSHRGTRLPSHNDATPGWKFTYNHIGQMTSVRDASGTREFSYDAYGRMIQDTSF
ncbi:RHS repeat protein [Akkermansia sp. BIOML-A17]|nr:RHS repeat protein [Akkermansia sp. BIOML-A17]